jgi:hypothetical protein
MPSDAPKKDEVILAEPEKKVESAPKEPEKPVIEPPAPVNYEFTRPEGLQMDEKVLEEVVESLRGGNVPAELGGNLLNRHFAELQRQADFIRENQQSVWLETNERWANEVRSSEEFGGNRFETARKGVQAAQDFLIGKDAEEVKAFNDFLKVTGVGNHPFYWKLMTRVHDRFMARPEPKQGNKPAPNAGLPPGQKDNRGGLLYDHPRSQKNRER